MVNQSLPTAWNGTTASAATSLWTTTALTACTRLTN